jgi:hypothetical protein
VRCTCIIAEIKYLYLSAGNQDLSRSFLKTPRSSASLSPDAGSSTPSRLSSNRKLWGGLRCLSLYLISRDLAKIVGWCREMTEGGELTTEKTNSIINWVIFTIKLLSNHGTSAVCPWYFGYRYFFFVTMWESAWETVDPICLCKALLS